MGSSRTQMQRVRQRTEWMLTQQVSGWVVVTKSPCRIASIGESKTVHGYATRVNHKALAQGLFEAEALIPGTRLFKPPPWIRGLPQLDTNTAKCQPWAHNEDVLSVKTDCASASRADRRVARQKSSVGPWDSGPGPGK
jgi:hypothetical protein